jgi:hypothetical protein
MEESQHASAHLNGITCEVVPFGLVGAVCLFLFAPNLRKIPAQPKIAPMRHSKAAIRVGPCLSR